MKKLETTAIVKKKHSFFSPWFISQLWLERQLLCSHLVQTQWDCSEVYWLASCEAN